MSETGEASVGGLVGNKLYQRRARQALPILVRQAKARQTILYSQLASELRISNPRTLNWPLGAIGNEMLALASKWGCKVPPIQALVVSKASGLPGDGISWFAPDAARFKAAANSVRRQIVDTMLFEVYEFNRWDEVLRAYDLSPLPPLSDGLPGVSEIFSTTGHDEGEGDEHRRLKIAVAGHPEWLGLPQSLGKGKMEFSLYSADRVDIVFSDDRHQIAVEIKPEGASLADLVRGVFQCVKYEAVLRAEEAMKQGRRECSSILVLGGLIPPQIVSLKLVLGVDVRDEIAKCGI
ncbi:hypothetical protein EVJ50_13250 [Synechococcus sp. RSCCF101]|uniref:hypothetical protein n=1 Tax=Synechococcus sp. RSCCF101 TaxID=2511069 RepID=UPI001247119C|nr:hypothetical protein [Synechococcus sp. RSCCF101]QEY33054.1 hypothetical protein EVJ50_13250 [Synechococcus sp. RSCCF101]